MDYMAESSTPCGDEQYRIVDELLVEQSKTDTLERYTRERYWYLVSTCWINKWIHYVTHFDKAVYPGKLTILHGHGTDDSVIHVEEFCGLDAMRSKALFTNMWAGEHIWCKWVQWYGVNDSHELERYTLSSREDHFLWVNSLIYLKVGPDTLLGHASKEFYLFEKCGYIELQLRRLFGVTHGTETLLWLLEEPSNPTLLDRSEDLMNYSGYDVRYYTGLFSLGAFTGINVQFVYLFLYYSFLFGRHLEFKNGRR